VGCVFSTGLHIVFEALTSMKCSHHELRKVAQVVDFTSEWQHPKFVKSTTTCSRNEIIILFIQYVTDLDECFILTDLFCHIIISYAVKTLGLLHFAFEFADIVTIYAQR
jgi:hypothetical protein